MSEAVDYIIGFLLILAVVAGVALFGRMASKKIKNKVLVALIAVSVICTIQSVALFIQGAIATTSELGQERAGGLLMYGWLGVFPVQVGVLVGMAIQRKKYVAAADVRSARLILWFLAVTIAVLVALATITIGLPVSNGLLELL